MDFEAWLREPTKDERAHVLDLVQLALPEASDAFAREPTS